MAISAQRACFKPRTTAIILLGLLFTHRNTEELLNVKCYTFIEEREVSVWQWSMAQPSFNKKAVLSQR